MARLGTKPDRLFLGLLLSLNSLMSSTFTWVHQRRSTRNPTTINLSVDLIPELVQEALNEPQTKANLLNDLAEASTDILIFSSEPSTIILRLTAVMERILGLSSDYLPNHSLRPEEILFNIPIVGASVFALTKSVIPIIQAQFVELDDFDIKAYRQCFAPVGVTFLQFKAMKATGCFEWIECAPGTVLIDENEQFRLSEYGHLLRRSSETDGDWKYMYWQYNGTVIKSYKETVFGVVERKDGIHIDKPEAQGLLGDTRFMCNIEAEQSARIRKEGDECVNRNLLVEETRHPLATMTIGENGAKMLRIDSYKLFDLMEHDEKLESSIRYLLLKSLKLKVGNLLRAFDRVCNTDDDSMIGMKHDLAQEPSEEGNMTLSI